MRKFQYCLRLVFLMVTHDAFFCVFLFLSLRERDARILRRHAGMLAFFLRKFKYVLVWSDNFLFFFFVFFKDMSRVMLVFQDVMRACLHS